ncbi:S24 family peptidase [Lysobacter olei]
MATTLKERLESALAAMANPPSQADLARLAGVKPPSVSDWFSGQTKSLRGKSLLAVASALNVNPTWLDTGRGPMRPSGTASQPAYAVREAGGEYSTGVAIDLVDARGSCGGGALTWELEDRPPLIKEPSWFARYKVRPDDLFAVFADGDSMADYIVDGDIVIFDKSKTEPKSGAIFLISHPDGLKIKRMRRDIEGSWVLESLNPDKSRYPEERVLPHQADLLQIKGQFVYRQGG